jgi:hypothetical protein
VVPDQPRLALTDAGAGIVAWRTSDESYQLRSRSVGGAEFGRAREAPAFDAIGVGPRGGAGLVRMDWPGRRLLARTGSAAGRFGTAQVVAAIGETIGVAPDVAVTPDRTAVVAWHDGMTVHAAVAPRGGPFVSSAGPR